MQTNANMIKCNNDKNMQTCNTMSMTKVDATRPMPMRIHANATGPRANMHVNQICNVRQVPQVPMTTTNAKNGHASINNNVP